jgi:hypothetical protein
MQEGADVDDYVANLEDWNQQRLLLARQHEGGVNVSAEMQLLDQHKPTIMHTIENSSKVHWLCYECAHRRNANDGRYSIERCPLCYLPVSVVGRIMLPPPPPQAFVPAICQICMSAHADCMAVPCNHVILCYQCAQSALRRNRNLQCCTCHTPIDRFIPV